MEKLRSLKNLAGEVYCTIYFDAASNSAVDIWTGNFGSQQNFKDGIRAVLKTIEKFRCTSWVADISRMQGSFDSSSEWLQTVVVPKAVKLGMAKQAVVLPKNIFSKLSARENAEKISDYTLKQFDLLEDALNWISESERKSA